MDLPPIVGAEQVAGVDGVVPSDVRWYLDGRSGHDAYRAGHLPGAVFVDLDQHLAAPAHPSRGRHPMPTAEAFARSLGALGIGDDDPVVAYDDGSGGSAGRLVWMLRLIGHPAALLDGGLGAWTGPLDEGSNERPATHHSTVPWPPGAFADADQVAATSAPVVDARAAARYRGEVEPVDARPGHVPGARNLPLTDNLGADGCFLPAAELAHRFRTAGIESDDDTIVYCGSGVSACQVLLSIEQAGLGAKRLYPGSYSQWSGDQRRPIATGDE